MNIVIIGLGKYGIFLTEQLSKENHDIVVIDSKQELVDEVVNQFDVKGYVGNGASYVTQKEAFLDKPDLVIAVTSTDEVNILCCLVSKKLGVKQTIARIRNPEYALQAQIMTNELGISMTINPDYNTALDIFRIIRFPSAITVESFANGKVNLVEIKVESNSKLVGKSLMQIQEKCNTHFLVCSVERGDKVFIPNGSFVLEEGDYVYITVSAREVNNSFKKLDIIQNKVKSAMIIGGGKITFYLASMLLDNGISVKIVENDPQICNHLAEQLPKTLILKGDGTNQKMLMSEGLEDVDALVTLTGMDEINIMISTSAKSVNCKKVITKVSNNNYEAILDITGLDSVISPKELFADNIIRYVRGMNKKRGSEFKTLYRLVGNKVEASEFLISKETKYTSIPLKDLNLRKNVLLACIIRSGKVIIPNGNDTLEPLDSVIVVTSDFIVNDLIDIME